MKRSDINTKIIRDQLRDELRRSEIENQQLRERLILAAVDFIDYLHCRNYCKLTFRNELETAACAKSMSYQKVKFENKLVVLMSSCFNANVWR